VPAVIAWLVSIGRRAREWRELPSLALHSNPIAASSSMMLCVLICDLRPMSARSRSASVSGPSPPEDERAGRAANGGPRSALAQRRTGPPDIVRRPRID
jgi:hypothetical protein